MNDTSDKYANFSHDELVAEINRLKKHKKYGLVWEHKTEKVIGDFETQQPYLEEVTNKRIEDAPGEPTNLIIEGDNFEALSILNYTHAGKVDVIYIDPPYNTGNKDFIYNDNYVDSEDEFRHSKWLSFMEPRLKLAKNLLKEDGVIFISIDDNEMPNLRCLCDKTFGEENFISNSIWASNKSVLKQSNYIRKDHEYVLVYGKCKYLTKSFRRFQNAMVFKNIDNDPKGAWFSSNAAKPGNSNMFKVRLPNGNEVERNWKFTEEEYRSGKVDLYFKGNNVPRLKIYESDYDLNTKIASSILETDATTSTGANDIGRVFNDKPFDFPKPVNLIKYLISMIDDNEVVVLDFFAGSGTTGQAVLELNKEDGGHRQFILCTNNGDKGPDSTKIAEEITYPRIKTVITGERQDGSKYSDGIPANLRYYKINHREKKPSIDANRQDIVTYMENIIQVKENAYKQLEVNEDFAIYESSEKYVGLVFEPFSLEEVIANLKELNSEKRPVKLYVFSYSRDAFEDDYDTDFEIEFVAMPEGLLKTYAHIVEEQKKEDL